MKNEMLDAPVDYFGDLVKGPATVFETVGKMQKTLPSKPKRPRQQRQKMPDTNLLRHIPSRRVFRTGPSQWQVYSKEPQNHSPFGGEVEAQ